MARRRRSTIFKKWDLQATFPCYLQGTCVRNSLYIYKRHASATCRVHSRCELIKPTTSVYIVCEQLIRHQPVVHMLACSEDFRIRVVRALFHTRVHVLQI